MRFPYCPMQRSVVRLRVGEKQVAAQGVVEDVGVLGDDPDPGSQIFLGIAADIPATESYLAAIGVPETQDQTYQRALARPARPHDRDPPSGPQYERDIPQRRRALFFIAEAHPVQRQRAGLWQGRGVTRVRDQGVRVGDLEEAFAGSDGTTEDLERSAERR